MCIGDLGMYRVLPSAYPTIPGQSEGGYNDPDQPTPGLDFYNADLMSYQPVGATNASSPPNIFGNDFNYAESVNNAYVATKLSGITAQNTAIVSAVRLTFEFTKIEDADGNDYVSYVRTNPMVKVFNDPDPANWTTFFSGSSACSVPLTSAPGNVDIPKVDYNLTLEVYDAQGTLLQSDSVSKSYVYRGA